MNSLIDRIYEVRGGSIRHYTGTYEEYVADLTELADEAAQSAGQDAAPAQAVSERREQQTRIRLARRGQEKLEAQMKVLDAEKSSILAYYFENPTDYAPDKATRLAELSGQLEALEKEWLRLEHEISS